MNGSAITWKRIGEGLWAEALNRYRGGLRARLPEDLHGKAAAVSAERHRNRDELLEDRIEALTIGDGARLVEIAEAVGLVSDVNEGASLHMRDSKRLAAALRNAGWSETTETTGPGSGNATEHTCQISGDA